MTPGPRTGGSWRRHRAIQGYPEPTWDGVLARRVSFPPWTDERMIVEGVNPRGENVAAVCGYLAVRL